VSAEMVARTAAPLSATVHIRLARDEQQKRDQSPQQKKVSDDAEDG